MLAGLRQTRMPAASMAAIFPAAVPCPPEIIAPAHAAPWRGRLTGNVPDHGLPDVCFHIRRRPLLGAAADLSDHGDDLCCGIILKQLQTIDELYADDWITTDTDTGGLPDSQLR